MTISYYPYPIRSLEAKYYRKGYRKVDSSKIDFVAKVISERPWSNIIWKDGTCHEKRFIGATWAALDFDDPNMSLEEAKSIWVDSIHIIGTTKSHQKDKHGIVCDRFRVLLKFDEIIHNLRTYKFNMRAYIEKYGADKACSDGARFFWPCTSIVSINADGYTQEVLQPPYQEEQEKPVFDMESYRKRPVSKFVESIVMNGVPKGQRNDTCFRACLELWRKDYTKEQIKSMVFAKIPTDDDFPESEKDRIIEQSRVYRDHLAEHYNMKGSK